MAKKYLVLQDFTDKNTKKVYRAGGKYPANAKKERIEELLGDTHNMFEGAIIELVEE